MLDRFPHISDHDIFLESLSYSEAQSGFTAALIEKDYYCSLVLESLHKDECPLVFKGGTCLSKIWTDFYRLSEDLDFMIPMAVDSQPSERKKAAVQIKRQYNQIPELIPGMRITENLTGHYVSRQYIGQLEYQSGVLDVNGNIKFEVGLREHCVIDHSIKAARAIILHPYRNEPLLITYGVRVIDIKEAIAEKLRAALTRRTPAIRDFYDLQYASSFLEIDFTDSELIELLRYKLTIPGNELIEFSTQRVPDLKNQLDAELRPVLHSVDYDRFNLDQVLDIVIGVEEMLDSTNS